LREAAVEGIGATGTQGRAPVAPPGDMKFRISHHQAISRA